MIRLYSFFLFILLFPFSSYSQFEGTISYAVTYEALERNKQEMLSMLPNKSVLYLKEEMSLFEQEVAGGGRQAFIIDAQKGSGILVMQFLGQGYKVEMSQEEIESLKKTEELNIVKTDELKTIAGFPCKKVLALTSSDTLEVFYTESLKSKSSFPPFAKIAGIPLQYELVRGGIKMKYTAMEVNETSLDGSLFTSAPAMKSMEFEDFARSFAISQ